jgi:hypothetical protein
MADVVLFSFYETSNGQTVDWRDRVVGFAKPPGEDYTYDDALKFTSELEEFTGHFGDVYCGKENAIDCNNRIADVMLIVDNMFANGCRFPVTIKGGCDNVLMQAVLHGHGRECDIDLGNWSDQSDEPVTNTILDIVPSDGQPVKIRCLNATIPMLRPNSGPYEYAFPNPHRWYHGIVVWFLFAVATVRKWWQDFRDRWCRK